MIYGGSAYKVFLVLHLLSVVIGLGPWFVNGLLPGLAAKRAEAEGFAVNDATYTVSNLTQFAIYGVFIFGMATLGSRTKGSGLSFGQTWVWLSLILWVVIVGILHGVVLPAQRQLKAGQGDRAALTQRHQIGVAAMNVIVVVVLFLMVFEPGHAGRL